MADNIQRSEYPSAKMPTVLEVNTDTGAAVLYRNNFFLGRTAIATSEPGSNGKWTITDKFAAEYNFSNGTKLSAEEAQQVFTKTLAKQSDNERAAIINKHTPPNAKTYMSTVSKIPGVIDPKTGLKPNETSPTTPVDDDEDGPSPAGSTPTGSTPAGSTLADIRNIESAGGTNAGIPKETTRYPIDIADTKQDIMQFDMLEYTPSIGADQKNFGSIQRPSASGEAIATTFLSVPGNIQDQNSANWGGGEMNPLQVEGLKLAYATITGGPEGSGDYLSDAKTKLEGMGGEIESGIAAYFAGQAVGVGQQALQRTSGAILNPNLELLFNGPSLRPFTFNFLLAPRSEKESQAAVNVIRFFKVGMSPIRSKSNLFLKTPNTFRIKYLHRGEGGSEHKFLNKFKECALLSVGVNYTPNANYATFTDGGMVAYQLTLSFQELEPVFNDNYEDDNSIGF